MSIWPMQPLVNLLENGQVSYGVVQPGNDSTSGIPIVRVKDIRAGLVDTSAPMRVDEEIANRHSRTTLSGGELLLTLVGTVGEVAVAPEALRGWNVARAVAVIRSSHVSSRWLQLCFETDGVRAELDSFLNTTVQSTLNLSDLKKIQVPVPPEAEREAIAEVLGALDDKIAANIKAEGLLVELARANWARSAIGTELVPLGTVMKVGLSGVWGEDARTESATFEVFALRGRDLEDIARRRDATPPKRWITPSQAARRIQNESPEIWTAGSGSQLGPTLLVTNELRQTHDLPVVYSNFVKRLVPVPGYEAQVPSAWFSMLLEWERSQFENFKIGTAFPNLDVGAMLAGIFVPVLIGDAIEQVKVWADLILRSELLDENRTLAATRDALLPHLMSGKLRVKDAEKVLVEVL